MLGCDELVIDEIDITDDLSKIELKYQSLSEDMDLRISLPQDVKENLLVLSKEFDALGVGELDLKDTLPQVFEQVVAASRNLVQFHRNAVSEIRDQKINSNNTHFKKFTLETKLKECRDDLLKAQEKSFSFQNKIIRLSSKIQEMHKREENLKEELSKVKKYSKQKQTAMEHKIKKLLLEYERLQEMAGENIGIKKSSNDVAQKLMQESRKKEEIYISTIKKLQENNKDLLNELLDIKEQLILCKSPVLKH